MPPLGFYTFAAKGTKLFDDILAHAREVKPILVQWTAVLKSTAREQFDDAPPLAASTRYGLEHRGKGAITQQGNIRASVAADIDSRLANKAKKTTGADAFRVDEARADLRRLIAGDLSKGGSGNKTIARLRRRAVAAKKVKAAGNKIAIGKKKIENHKRGGKMRNAFRGKIKGLKATVQNMVAFSGVHDTGGTVGNHATLPPWNFTRLGQQVSDKLARIAVDWLLGGIK